MGTDLPKYSACQYGPEHVEAIRRGLQRSVTDPELKVLVDEHFLDLGEPFAYDHVGGWSRRMEAFAPENAPPPGERYVLFDLDQIIVGPCDWLWDWDEAPLGMPRDPYVPEKPCSTVVSYDNVGAAMMWEAYHSVDGSRFALPKGGQDRFSEMEVMRYLFAENDWPFLEDEPRRLLSYKVHVTKKRMSWNRASIVYFHGRPKPQDLPSAALRGTWER